MGQLEPNTNTRPVGALPSDTKKKPQVNAVTLKNGRELKEAPNKRRDTPIPEGELIPKSTECISRVQNKLPQKLKDPSNFTIPVRIGNIDVGCAFCDFGANINLMPLSLCKQLVLGASRPTTVMLQLADRSIAYPERMIEDVLLQIEKFIFPVDFIILDYEADEHVPIILG
ncbi:uncharacterized protein LOC107766120 [Nicotiana tabacum]|uniref:Uncharacterized protein LOC107766120 n=2 Tax=Nicotiana TaxID=4085 RepID=A0A1S3XKH3_TOBAC|nr:PREDICTED: uncharacterized protein LOC104213125 [Nicotiana sylvestris]XP_016440339.1 PREDICTED: uncharacterized protein LOC107766120 [Nicotiana tabacum]